MARTIFDLVQPTYIASYYNAMLAQRAPYLGESLFPAQQKLGLDLSYIKGAAGIPVVLKPAAFDTKVVIRERVGADSFSAEMPFFKESMVIDEKTRQQLLMFMDSENQSAIDMLLNNVFDDVTNLLNGAAAQRERLRMLALCTGTISITANGEILVYDYGIPEANKVDAATPWSVPTAPISQDVQDVKSLIEDTSGDIVANMLVSRKTFNDLLKNTSIAKSMFVLSSGNVIMTDSMLKSYFADALGLNLVVYSKKFKDETGTTMGFVPDDTAVFYPDGALGTTWMGTTPEEADLMSGVTDAVVSTVDNGVAITQIKETDPVMPRTKVSQICLPSMPSADSIVIMDTGV